MCQSRRWSAPPPLAHRTRRELVALAGRAGPKRGCTVSEHYPRVRVQARSGVVVVREGLSLTFYMRPPHEGVVQRVLAALDVYMRRIAPRTLGLYADEEGYWRELHVASWGRIRREMLERGCPIIHLQDAEPGGGSYAFQYLGKDQEFLTRMHEPDAMCEATFWLPTEFLEEHGPGRVRDLALEIASVLPFCSGSCGLAFIGGLDLVGVSQVLARHWMRHPGIDVSTESGCSFDVGTRLRGPHWMNFLGQPVLGALGGAEGLRARLQSSGTTVQELAEDKVIITLGAWPEAGDTERGDVLPAYRELARVQEPWLYHSKYGLLRRPLEETRRWERRFLD